MQDMRNRLKDVKSRLEQKDCNKLMRQQLIIAGVRYTAAQNIVLAYKEFNNVKLTIQGVVRDVQIDVSEIVVIVGCIIYGYTDAAIVCRMELSESNILDVQSLITGNMVVMSGVLTVKNNDVILSKAQVVNSASSIDKLKTLETIETLY